MKGSYMKKKIILLALTLSTTTAFSAPLELKCNTKLGRISINVQNLVGSGCNEGIIYAKNNTLRYKIDLCNGNTARGVMEVQDINNNWIEIDQLYTKTNCYTFRRISSADTCRRNGHGC